MSRLVHTNSQVVIEPESADNDVVLAILGDNIMIFRVDTHLTVRNLKFSGNDLKN